MAGPLKTLGKIFNTIGTVVDVVDNTVSRTASLLDTGFDAIDLPVNNMLEDLKCDNIVADAQRRQRMATAQSEADEIISALAPKPKRAYAKKTTTK